MTTLSIDFETRSTVDLKTSGVYPYAQHKHTGIWCMAYAFDDEEVALWTPNDVVAHGVSTVREFPARILEHIHSKGEIRAHNAQFERVLWQYQMTKLGWPAVAREQFVCTAAEAAAMSLPRSLDGCAKALGLTTLKDTEGHNLMMRMARPRRLEEDGTPVWWEELERMNRLFAYCKQDVRVEREIKKAIRRLSPLERKIFLLDQTINDRGVAIDIELATAATHIVAEGMKRANVEIDDLTGGLVPSITNHKSLAAWAGVESVSKPNLKESLEDETLDPKVRRAFLLRQEAGRTSVAKLKSMLEVVASDMRAHGLFLYYAATTGRWGGRLIQPQNFPRGEVDKPEEFIDAVMKRDYNLLDLFGAPIVIVLSLLRGMLRAKPGHDLIAGDFASIEARIVNWLAGQDDVLELFRAYDAGDKSKDPYKVMAVKMGRATSVAEVTKQDRQAGKAAELGCGFGMGAEKFISAAWDVYQVRVTPEEAKAAVEIYRSTHAKVKSFWYETENAAIHAVQNPGTVVPFGGRRNLKALCSGNWLVLQLPSGRPLFYAAPKVEDKLAPWGEMKASLTYKGVHAATNQWVRMDTYGGHLVENLVQAVARDLLAEGMLRLEAAGYPIVLHAHDEAVAEVPSYPYEEPKQPSGKLWSEEEFGMLLGASPDWAGGLPIAVETWRGERYRK